jgi:hypothetical protein
MTLRCKVFFSGGLVVIVKIDLNAKGAKMSGTVATGSVGFRVKTSLEV